MELHIGETIMRLRRQNGLTQEQLAHMVGVSTPAVSKWETGASYPDITMLAPIARALGVNLDTLMDFAARLTEAECAAFALEVANLARHQGDAAAMARIVALLRAYPKDPGLQLQLSAVMIAAYQTDAAESVAMRAQAKTLLEAVTQSGDARLIPSAANLLAGLCLGDGELDRAEHFLSMIPESIPTAETLRACVFEKKSDFLAARKILQSQLLTSFAQMQTCLAKLAGEAYCKDADAALWICDIHEKLAVLLGYPLRTSDVLRAEIYLRAGDLERAAQSLDAMAASLCQIPACSENSPFGELIQGGKSMDENLSFLRKRVLESLQQSEEYADLRTQPATIEAIRRLEAMVNAE